MAVPITTYLNIARICQYLAADGNSKKLLLQGGGNRPAQSALLNIVRESVQWLYDLNPNDSGLPKQANYMYSLCNPYVHQAEIIAGAGMAGVVINPSTGNLVTYAFPVYQFRVGDISISPMQPGQTVLTIPYAGIINPSVEVTLGGTEIPYGDSEQFSFTATYNPTNVQIVFSNPVEEGWLFIIHLAQLISV